MISQLAKEDLQDLRDAGLQPSDEDVVRLHALALRITDGPETNAANAPRWATAGAVVFYEPTVGAREWFRFARAFVADEDTEDMLFAFACANGRRRGYLDALRDKADIERALGQFLFSLNATASEVTRAVNYVTLGLDRVEPAEAKKTDPTKDRGNYDALEDLIQQAAASTGLTMDDILTQTPSRLWGMIYAANVKAGMEMTKTTAKAHAEYLATLHEIRQRLTAERNASRS